MFTVTAIGKDGNQYIVHLDVDDIFDCENIIQQLDLNVPENGYGKLVGVEIYDYLEEPCETIN